MAGEIQIPTSEGTIPGYHAMPAKGRAFPVVLVVQEIFGVHEHIKDVCRRFAKQGYLAIAPELYARQGDVSKAADIGQIMPIVSKVPDEQVMTDLDAAVIWAENSGHGDVSKLGYHRLLLGRADRLALCGPQSDFEGGHRLVRASGRPGGRAAPAESDGFGCPDQGPRAGAVRRAGPGHLAGQHRGDAGRPEGGGRDGGHLAVHWSTRTPATASTPTTGPPTTPRTLPTATRKCTPG